MVKGWKNSEWGEVLDGFSSGATPYRGVSNYYNGKIKWVSSGELNYNYIEETLEHISEQAQKDSSLTLHPKGTFLMAITGLEAAGTRGRCAILNTEATTNQSCMAIYGTPFLDIKYLYHYYINNGDSLALKFCQGTKQQSYTAKIVKKLPIFHPIDTVEQAEIAKALSEADAYIVSLEKLIAKKKSVKIGAMQELLTGKRRLKGFTGKWCEKKLGEFGNCIRGVSYNPNTDLLMDSNSNTVNLLRANNIVNGKMEYSEMQFVVSGIVSDDKKLLPNDIIIAMSSGSRIAIGKSAFHSKKGGQYCVGAFCAIFRSSTNSYIKYLFQTNSYRKQLENVLEGTSINNLNGKQIEQLVFSFPLTEKEQTAIANILSDMDAEIDALTVKLNKAKAIKAGMMQQLLTGQIRLVDVCDDEDGSKLRDAVIYAGIVDIWGREPLRFPLGRVKVAKLFYLYTRKTGGDLSRFKEHAAGPYDETIRYGGGETIAIANGYIHVEDGEDSSMFTYGDNIAEAKKQLYDDGAVDALKWLMENFKTASREELELLATVDNTRYKLESTGRQADAESVRDYISKSKEWAPKLDKTEFHISKIVAALKQSRELFK